MTETLRAPRDEDAPAVAHLMSEHSPEPVDELRILRAWTSPRFERDLDARLDDGSYALIEDLDDGRVWLELHGQPSAALLDWAETRAGEKGRRVFSGGWSSNEPILQELAGRAFHLVRYSHRMEIDLSEPAGAPSWPDEIAVRTFRAGDELVLYDVIHETFEDSWEPVKPPYDEWAHWMLQPPVFVPDLWFLALAGEELAGFAICHPHPGDPELGWVGILGVRRPWRRQGLGRALLLHSFAEFRLHGLRRAGLGVDAESLTGANRLYEQAGMHVAARFDIYEKQLA